MPARTVAPNTPPRSATSSLLCIVTPFHWHAWESLLCDTGVLEQFVDVLKGIHFSWHLGVDSSYVLSLSFFPQNHHSALEHLDFILDYISSELAENRYLGPFSPSDLEALIGPCHSSPLGVIPKPGSAKFRLIQDHSFPRGDPLIPSVNSLIDTLQFDVVGERSTIVGSWSPMPLLAPRLLSLMLR